MDKTSTIKESYLKFIPYSNLDKWYVSYYLNPFTVESTYNLTLLEKVIKPIKSKIKKNEYNGNIPVISKIGFKDGEIYLRGENETGMDLYVLDEDQLLISKINFHQGAVSINKIGKLVCSTHYQPYQINNDLINSEYLTLTLRSDGFLNFVKHLRADGIKNEATYEFIGKLKIPLPLLPEQNRLVKAYNKRMQLAKQQEQRTLELEQDIENYLFEMLDIEKKFKIKLEEGLHFINYNDISVWGVDKLLKGAKSDIIKSNKYPNKLLSEVVFINPRTDLSSLNNNDKMSFIPMKNVSDDYGEVITLLDGEKAESKGYTKFKNGDLIWARITPCMQNGKSAIVKGLANGYGYGSTEYHVIRGKDKNVDIQFVYHLLRSKAILEDAIHHFTGSAGQQRVPKTYLENMILPVPPLKTQTEIAKTISKMKAGIKSLQKQADENRKLAIEEFEQEIFTA